MKNYINDSVNLLCFYLLVFLADSTNQQQGKQTFYSFLLQKFKKAKIFWIHKA